MSTVITGKGIEVFRALAVANALDLYHRTRIRANTAYTPKNMMRVATEITGQWFRARDYEGAAAALREWVKKQDPPDDPDHVIDPDD